MSTVVYPIRVLARLGVKDIISALEILVIKYLLMEVLAVTNAAGSLNPDISVGTSKNTPSSLGYQSNWKCLLAKLLSLGTT